MKGSITPIITIIFTVMVIISIIILLPSIKNSLNYNCVNVVSRKIDLLKSRSCQMTDVDLEYIEEIDLSCLEKITYVENQDDSKLLLKPLDSKKEYSYKTVCEEGYYGFVDFDFSTAGDKYNLNIKKEKYNFLISPFKIKLVFCEGNKDCYNLSEDECQKNTECKVID
ncbi:MAG: hypothetical protein QW350_01565 [Candidatus Aenigmatarchaeota archaeon]|nr:hypothetical protein [Candidatus Aenigmarchaeota archaeon]